MKTIAVGRPFVLAMACYSFSLLQAAVKPLSTTLTIDGKLDEVPWSTADWESDFVTSETAGSRKLSVQTSFAMLADAKTLYVGIKCFDPKPDNLKPGSEDQQVSLLLAPSGDTFDFYEFTFGFWTNLPVRVDFASEGGNIHPEPYAPELTVRSAKTKEGWSLEVAIPLSSFYMTRHDKWSEKWLVNVGRRREKEESSWSPVVRKFAEAKRMRELAGLPKRAVSDDVALLDLAAKIAERRANKFVGTASLRVLVGAAGEYELSADRIAPRRLVLTAGENLVTAEAGFPALGRQRVKLALKRIATGETYRRTAWTSIDFTELKVRLTTPAYRDNFYPGQCADRVKGLVTSAMAGPVTVTLEGPGFPARATTLPEGGGAIDFDTTGFQDGEATLTAVAAGQTVKTRILKLAPTGHDMSWVENGHIVLNGKQILPRRMYSEGYRGGRAFEEKFQGDATNRLCLTRQVRVGGLLVSDYIVKGIEREAIRDVKPCQELLDGLAKLVEKNRDKDFTCWYINDEPECRSISPVYLNYVYEYMKKIDPYHVILTSSRGGSRYTDCADWIETHPYINPHDDGRGNRVFGDSPARIGNYLDAFQAWDRPDKCIGFLPTAFAYRSSSPRNDYPTYDEYVMHTWAGMMHGGKSLNPYAYHDMDDRPGIYEGVCYTFSSFAALEDIVLNGKRTWLVKSDTAKCVRYDLPTESMFVLVNPTLKPQTATVKGIDADYREFRGTRTWSGTTAFKLKPCEVIVATTKRHDEGLESAAQAKARADRLEAERLGRDNQLLMKAEEIVTSGSRPAAGLYKLFDGSRTMQAWVSTWQPDTYLDLSFKNAHRFHILRVFGSWDHDPVVSAWRDGAWEELVPERTQKKKYGLAFDFGKPLRTYKIRLSFRRPKKTQKPRNFVELYEIELGRDGAEMSSAKGKGEVSLPKNPLWLLTGENAKASPKHWESPWLGSSDAVLPSEDGGFTMHKSAMNYQVRLTPEFRWFTAYLRSFVSNAPGYHGWSVSCGAPVGYLAGATTNPQAGLFTIPLPKIEKDFSSNVVWYDYNFDLGFAYAAFEKEPEEYLLCACADGASSVTTGTKLAVTLKLRDPADEVVACFLRGTSGGLASFPINNSEAIQMRRADKKGCLWRGEVDVSKCGEFKENGRLYVRATVLGGKHELPIFTLTPPFVGFSKAK